MALPQTIKNILYIALAFTLLPMIPTGMQFIKKIYSRNFDPRSAVGIVKIKGILYDSTPYIKQLTKLFKDETIKAILLKIDCSGSASGTGETIFRTITALKEEHRKPIVVLVENICTSGAYYIASGCDHIVTPASALIGSIGVRLSHTFQLKKFLEQYNITYEPVKAGTYKTAADPFTDMTPEERAHLQGVLDDTYTQFTNDVAKQRKLAHASINEWADGRIFTGKQAVKIGLADEIGTLYHATKVIKEKALIENEIKWVHKTPQRTLLSMLRNDGEDENGSFAAYCSDAVCTYLESRYASKLRM